MKSFLAISVAMLAASWTMAAQTPAPAAGRVTGTVTAVTAASKQISVKTDKGDTITLTTTDRSFVLHLPPGETDIKKATKMTLGDVATGDRLVASGQMSADQKSMDARTILVMTRADVAEVQKKEQDDWQKRGTTGTVTAIDPAAKTLAIKVGARDMTVLPGEKADFKRYSPDSAKFADAKPSTFADIKTGDQVRVLGDKNADNTQIKAEKIVAGTFRQLAATIEAIDAAAGELKVKDLATKKLLIIKIDSDSQMKKLPAQLASRLAMRYASGGRGAGAGAAGGGAGAGAGAESGRGGFPRPDGQAGAGAGAAAGGPGGFAGRGGRGGAGDIGQTLDQLPPMQLAELKTGDAIMVSTTLGSDPGKVTAITLLAGVEPLLTASPSATRDIMGGWNLGGGGGEGN